MCSWSRGAAAAQWTRTLARCVTHLSAQDTRGRLVWLLVVVLEPRLARRRRRLESVRVEPERRASAARQRAALTRDERACRSLRRARLHVDVALDGGAIVSGWHCNVKLCPRRRTRFGSHPRRPTVEVDDAVQALRRVLHRVGVEQPGALERGGLELRAARAAALRTPLRPSRGALLPLPISAYGCILTVSFRPLHPFHAVSCRYIGCFYAIITAMMRCNYTHQHTLRHVL